MGTAEENNSNAPTAFVLVIAAGLSTCIGAALVFNKRLVKLASKRFLAGALGIAAGVMLYVSLVEIFVKSQDAFSNAGHSEADAYMWATVCLFGGILFYKGIDVVVHLLDGSAGDHSVNIDLYDLDQNSLASTSPRRDAHGLSKDLEGSAMTLSSRQLTNDVEKPSTSSGRNESHPRHQSREIPHHHDVVVELGSGNSTVRPSPDLHTLQLRMAGKIQQSVPSSALSPVESMTPAEGKSPESSCHSERNAKVEGTDTVSGSLETDAVNGGLTTSHVENAAEGDSREDKKLVRMGLMTAVAIGIHNFPEGLATFVAALSDPSVGFALAVAIAIHNIPEGLCVAIPVYYATGNRMKAFLWALLSGVSEPIGAGLGWLVLKDVMSETVYGILFGMVGGMMVNIVLHELIPTAVRYDPADKVTTNSIIVGMAIMALSLTLFLYS